MTEKYETHEAMVFARTSDSYRENYDRIFRKEPAVPTRESLEAHAKASGLTLNPDPVLVNGILKGLEKRKGLCPCRVPSTDPVVQESQRCPCTTHMDEIKATGFCHCRLFQGPKAES